MNAPIVRELGISLSGGGTRSRLAALIVLGLEMGYRRRALGYEGGGSWQAHRTEVKSGARKRWEDYCKAEAGITETMVRHYLECADSVRTRITLMGGSDKRSAKVLKLMESQPSTLTEKQRAKLFEGIYKYVFDTDTQARLREEFRARRTDKPLNLPPAEELKEQIDGLRDGREMKSWINSSEPRALEFRRKLAQLYLRRKRDEETLSLARACGVSEKTVESMGCMASARRFLEETGRKGGME